MKVLHTGELTFRNGKLSTRGWGIDFGDGNHGARHLHDPADAQTREAVACVLIHIANVYGIDLVDDGDLDYPLGDDLYTERFVRDFLARVSAVKPAPWWRRVWEWMAPA